MMKKYEKYETYVCPEKVKFIYFYFYFFLNKPNRILPRDLRSQQPKKTGFSFRYHTYLQIMIYA